MFIFIFYSLFFIIILSKAASNAGNSANINTSAHKVPCDSVLQIFDVIPDVNFPTTKVTRIKIDADVNIVLIDLYMNL